MFSEFSIRQLVPDCLNNYYSLIPTLKVAFAFSGLNNYWPIKLLKTFGKRSVILHVILSTAIQRPFGFHPASDQLGGIGFYELNGVRTLVYLLRRFLRRGRFALSHLAWGTESFLYPTSPQLNQFSLSACWNFPENAASLDHSWGRWTRRFASTSR